MAVYNKLFSFLPWSPSFNGVKEPLLTKKSDMDSVGQIAKDLAHDTVCYFTEKDCDAPVNSHAKTLRRTVDELLDRHILMFNGILKRLSINRQNWELTFTGVADEMFSDGQYNWGRLVTIYAFAGFMARHCKEHGMEDIVPQIAERTGIYISDKLLDWVNSEGGWDTFDQFFPEKIDPENVLWNGLLYTFVGLGALATMAAVSAVS